ncbi:hypothetical protein TNCV_2035611 [Trichonephila clavipes]|nr:hypothetical protein TNCV_2035611 [Trichonephila clavipes]
MELETPLRFFRSSLIGRMCAHYSAIADHKLVTLTSLVKMRTPQQKVQCVLCLWSARNLNQRVQRRVRTECNVNPPKLKSVSDRGWLCHEFEPSTAKDPPCRAVMHTKSIES